MYALACQCIQISRKRRHQRLTFTGPHLGNTSLMQDHSADDLHTEMPQSDHTYGRLSYNRICFRQNIIQSLPVRKPLLKFPGLALQFIVRQLLYLRFQRLYRVHDRIDPLQLIFAMCSEYFLY